MDTEPTGDHPPEPVAPGTVAAVQIKLPPFWPKDPELWFAQIESQFSTRGITVSKTKFDHVVSSLSPEFATEVRDLLLRPPAETPYEQLKAELTRRTSASEQRRIKELLSNEELGDRTPSQVLRRIQQLLGSMATTMDATLLRELFLQWLPPNVWMVLTPSAAALSLEQLAQLADRIVEASPTPATISAVDTHSQLTTQVMELSKRLDQLTNQMSGAINNITKRHGRSPSPGRRRRRRSSISRDEDSTHPLCWYHRKFGDNAKKCQPPCQKSGND